ncbi:hypothetical protein AL515_23315 [Citrobacter sp. FDAARGOS_156]|uniref:Uncharacterized protein n=1 Tax=Citrobacter pasteurii TaxID=1563222 RepID=A0A6N6JXW0_9ENTR|nr:hypothetical protein AL515_23315 [Citrobacter sp. FDAARGOS_156]KAA1275132.1 hypothetical protein DXF85_21450 [Citrobacter pasteurii]RPH27519.1 hypothetical protein EHN13_03275 [Citrobacter youngae]
MATDTPASRATSFMVAMIVPVVGKRLHPASVTENGCLFKQIARQDVANVSGHERSKTENRK